MHIRFELGKYIWRIGYRNIIRFELGEIYLENCYRNTLDLSWGNISGELLS